MYLFSDLKTPRHGTLDQGHQKIFIENLYGLYRNK